MTRRRAGLAAVGVSGIIAAMLCVPAAVRASAQSSGSTHPASSGPVQARSTAAAPTGSADDWPTFGQDALHTGVSPDTAISRANASTLSEVWQVKKPEGTQASPIVVYNSTLDKTLVYLVRGEGLISALNAANGAVVWQFPTNQGANSTPAYYDNTLYFGNHAGQLYEVNATTGAVDCIYQLPDFAPLAKPGRIQSSPVVGTFSDTGPIVYFEDSGDSSPSEDQNAGHAWAVTGQGNTMGACNLVWDFNGWNNIGKDKTETGAWSEPSLVQDSQGTWLMVFGTTNPDDSVYALNAATGAEVWRLQTAVLGGDQDVGAGPTISAPGYNGYADGMVYINGKDAIEYGLDLLTGQAVWSFNMGKDVGTGGFNAEGVGDLVGNNLYQVYGGYVYDFDALTGAVIWRTASSIGSTYTSPSVHRTAGAAGSPRRFPHRQLRGGEHCQR